MKVEQLIAQKAEIYLRYDSGELSSAEYEIQSKKLAANIEKCRSRLASGTELPDHGEDESVLNCRGQIGSLKVLSNLRTLDRDTVDRLIRMIRVYADGRIEIVWNFNDDYMRLLDEAQEGETAAVFVKNLSRLGRNYIEVGRLTEEFFPEHDIRLVAVSDCTDTDEGENELASIKNLFNEWYARDISKSGVSATRSRATPVSRWANRPMGMRRTRTTPSGGSSKKPPPQSFGGYTA